MPVFSGEGLDAGERTRGATKQSVDDADVTTRIGHVRGRAVVSFRARSAERLAFPMVGPGCLDPVMWADEPSRMRCSRGLSALLSGPARSSLIGRRVPTAHVGCENRSIAERCSSNFPRSGSKRSTRLPEALAGGRERFCGSAFKAEEGMRCPRGRARWEAAGRHGVRLRWVSRYVGLRCFGDFLPDRLASAIRRYPAVSNS